MKARLQQVNGSSAKGSQRSPTLRRAPRPVERLDRLVAKVYEASVRPDAWHPALAALAEAVGADAVTLLGVSIHGPLREIAFGSGASPSAEASYRDHFAAVDPWESASSAKGPHAAGDEQPGGYYQPPGWQHGFAARLLADEGSLVAAIAGHRLHPRARFDAPELALVRQLVPHLRRALRLGHEVALTALERDAGEQLLDRNSIGVIVADEHARIVRANAVGRSVLAARDGLCLGPTGLEAASHRETRALRRAIADSLQRPRCVGGAARLPVARPSGARPYLVEVTPLDRTAGIWGSGRALAMIQVNDGDSAPTLSPEPLRMVYGLTRSEAELAIRLAQGRSLDEFRAERGVTSNTARGQLKKVFHKTGTHRQADLVRVVLQGTPFRR